MSCPHGNHEDGCDICDEIDTAYKSGIERGKLKIDSLTLLLKECDAALGMVGSEAAVKPIREKIQEVIPLQNG